MGVEIQQRGGKSAWVALWVCLAVVVFILATAALPERRELAPAWLEDPAGEMTLTQVRALGSDAWHQPSRQTINQGYTNSRFWLRVDLPTWSEGVRYLGVDNPLLENITFYREQRSGEITAPVQMGMALPFAERPLPFVSFVLPLTPADSGATLWLRVHSRTSVQVPLSWWDETGWARRQQHLALFHGGYVGVVLAMLAYNLLLYRGIRERAYLWYLGWMVCIAGFVLTLNGSTYQWLWPHWPAWNLSMLPVSLALAIACSAAFFLHFVREDGRPQAGESVFWWLCAANLALAVAAAAGLPYHIAIVAAIALALMTVAAATIAAAMHALRGNFGARYFLIAFGFVIGAGVVLAFSKFGLLPRTFITEHATEVGSALEMVALSLAMVARFNHQRRLREQAQSELLGAQQRLNSELELRVAERTQALQVANDKLMALSMTDPLTGLANRRQLDARLEQELSRMARHGKRLALMLIDVDHFKRFNDTHGHPAGDACLRAVATALKATLKKSLLELATG